MKVKLIYPCSAIAIFLVFFAVALRPVSAGLPQVVLKYGGYAMKIVGGVTTVLEFWNSAHEVVSRSKTETGQQSSGSSDLVQRPLSPAEQNTLGLAYLYGKAGVEKNPWKAQQAFEAAVAGGNLQAKVNIGVMYADGVIARLEGHQLGVPDWRLAARQFYTVIKQNSDPVAEYDLAVTAEHLNRRDSAFYWYIKSAEQNYADAKTAVSRLCPAPDCVDRE